MSRDPREVDDVAVQLAVAFDDARLRVAEKTTQLLELGDARLELVAQTSRLQQCTLARRLVTLPGSEREDLVAIVGPSCSGATNGMVQSVTIPAGVVVLSDSATAPSISELDDNGTVFRVAPSALRSVEG